MTDPSRPSLFRRVAPWALAIGLGIGVGWMVGGMFGPGEEGPGQVARPASDTPAAPPPVAPKTGAPAPTPAPVAGPPMALAISNSNCHWGPDFAGYYRQGSDIIAQTGDVEAQEMASVRVRVPARPWQGLTVTAVETFHEGAGIIFAEPEAEVRAVFARLGVRVEPDGTMPMGDDGEQGAMQSLLPTEGSARRYGATALRCGA